MAGKGKKSEDDGNGKEIVVIESSFVFQVKSLLAVEKRRVATQIRQTHLRHDGKRDPETDELLELLAGVEDWITSKVAGRIKEHPVYHWFSRIKGVGRENIAKVVGLIHIQEAPSISSLWKFAGYAVVNGKAPKPVKGTKLPYCGRLRTMCWRLAGGLLRAKGSYFKYYQQEKEKYIRRFTIDEGKKIVPALTLPKVKGKHVETDELISEGHVHLMALRKMIKLFLSHLWMEWRKAEGLPTRDPYPIEKLAGHTRIITPQEMMDRPARKKARRGA